MLFRSGEPFAPAATVANIMLIGLPAASAKILFMNALKAWDRSLVIVKAEAVGLAAAALSLSGCYTPTSSGSVYSAGEARNEQTVRVGVVESVRQVTIEGTRGELGTVAGGALGGIGGSTVGGGSRGSAVGTILGAVAGGIAGSAIERSVTQKKGLEITVRLENGDLRAIKIGRAHV